MPLMPINSLQDLLTIRELKNQANPTYSAIKSLADGIALGIQEKQEEAKKKKEKEEKLAQITSLMGTKGKTNSVKIKTAIDKEGGVSYTLEQQDEKDLEKERLANERLKIQQDSEERRQYNDYGRSFNTNNPDDNASIQRLGLDLNKMIESGKAERNSDGTIYVYDRTTRNRIEENKTVPDTIQKAIYEFKDSKDILTDSINEYKSLGLDEVKSDWNIFKQITNPVGPLSVEAKSNLLRQIKSPRLAALADKLERVFQKYRTSTTGAQASDLELQRLRPLIANLSESPETFLLNSQELLKELNNSVQNRIGVSRMAGRDEKVLNDLERFYSGTINSVGNYNSSNSATSVSPINYKERYGLK